MAGLLTSCDSHEPQPSEPQLVVEGHIDDGGFPMVLVTTSLAVSSGSSEHLDSLSSHLLRWARVAVSDGRDTVVLTGRLDHNYLPPFVYTTTRMRGQAGRSYTLTVDYGTLHATAVTTIPQRPQVDSIWVKPVVTDSLYSVVVTMHDPPAATNYYKTFVTLGRRGRQWLPAYLGTISDQVLGSESHITINRPTTLADTAAYTPFFGRSDSVTIHFAQIDADAYRFWNDYDNQTNFARNPLLSSSTSLRGNLRGGLGCWYGTAPVSKSIIFADH